MRARLPLLLGLLFGHGGAGVSISDDHGFTSRLALLSSIYLFINTHKKINICSHYAALVLGADQLSNSVCGHCDVSFLRESVIHQRALIVHHSVLLLLDITNIRRGARIWNIAHYKYKSLWSS